MNFLIDESVDFPIILHLRESGHHVISILEDHPGQPDEFVLNLAQQERRVLITIDKDFGELIFRLKKVHSGVILLRVEKLTSLEKAKLLISTIEQHEKELINSFTVIREKFIRIRK